ncbi:MAG TPA: excinuclease ABC subunit UvrA [Terriglobales bacterium]|nr:excinuclease ABC subunit UvrA [Terriglobales bacterium]
MSAAEFLSVHGARLHNLKNLSVDIPLNALTVVTGVSGSGKSSLAFDTIYAEGQRRYVESLSAYARQFLERMEKPEVDAIEGIAPAIAIRQKSSSRNPRSSVATATEIYDYLRLLFARAGRIYCPDCNLQVERNDVDSAVAALLAQAPGQRCLLLFPAHLRGGEPGIKPRLAELRARGFNRLWQAGKLVEFSTPESLLDLDLDQPVFVLVDRLLLEADAPELRTRLVDGIEIAYREAGEAVFEFPPPAARAPLRFNQRFECKRCRRSFESPEPSLFSFNNPFGACPHCQGFGRASEISLARVVPDPDRSLAQGAIEPWNTPRGLRWRNALKRVSEATGLPLDRPWRQLTPAQQKLVWSGVGKFPGVEGFFALLERKKYRVHVRVFLSRFREYTLCPACRGARLRPEALCVQLRSHAVPGERFSISQATALTVAAARDFFAQLVLSQQETAVAQTVLLEVQRRLDFLLKVGLEYLSLGRAAATLSGGEAQRIQLATCLGSQLVGALYVLDEPSIGLHPRDTARLIAILRELRDLGNTLLVVEHDPDVMRSSDHLLDLGPGAGEQGGSLVAAGPWKLVAAEPASLTGQYLCGARAIPVPKRRRPPGRRMLTVRGATLHNLRGLDLEIPLDLLVAVTGVSGSGKSTLVHDVLHRNLRFLLGRESVADSNGADASEDAVAGLVGCRSLEGAVHLHEVVLVDQSPIGRTPRSNPVTYLKAFDGIRDLFAQQPAARKRGLRAGHFSFNVAGGRCETCQGEGVVTVDMQFLADVELVCEECNGTRYQASILAVELQGRNIHQVLQLSVAEALHFFAGHEKILRPLRLLDEIGLGYLRLGQSATTLSGGEAQRLKLASHLATPRAAAGTLFLLDEPTTGLHFDDIAKLLAALQRLLAAGGSVVVIEHNLEVIKAADWIVDLGPEAGDAGGRLVAEGPPETVAASSASHLAPFLRAALKL